MTTLKGNHKRRKFWTAQAAVNDPRVGELLLYGEISSISWWGDEVTPKQFADDLKALGDIDTLNVYINSGGGDVFAGQAIYSQLKRHKATVNVYVDGLAASIASVIAMAGDKVIAPRNALLMIHNPWTMAFGEAEDFRKMADDLDKIRESIIAVYEEKTGLENVAIVDMMDEETWMTAEEAFEHGFVDEIEESKHVAAAMRPDGLVVVNGREFDLSRYERPPKLALLPPSTTEEPPPEPAPDPEPGDDTNALERAKAVLALELELLHAAPF